MMLRIMLQKMICHKSPWLKTIFACNQSLKHLSGLNENINSGSSVTAGC